MSGSGFEYIRRYASGQVQLRNKKVVIHVNSLVPRLALSAASAALVLVVAGCSSGGSPNAQQARNSAPTTLRASGSTSATWQSSALPMDATTLWRQPDEISSQTNAESDAKPGSYTLAMECVGTGTLTLTLTAGSAKPVSATADCATTGNAQVTAVLPNSGDVVSEIAVSGKPTGSMVWRLSRV
jgi:hypothetical protein